MESGVGTFAVSPAVYLQDLSVTAYTAAAAAKAAELAADDVNAPGTMEPEAAAAPANAAAATACCC